MKSTNREISEYEFKNLKKKEFEVLMRRSEALNKQYELCDELASIADKRQKEAYEYQKEIKALKAEMTRMRIEHIADMRSATHFVSIANNGGTHREKEYLSRLSNDHLKGMISDREKELGAQLDAEHPETLPF